jgi:hypothetical protein
MRSDKAAAEDAALNLLMEHLRQEGHIVDIVSRPDRLIHDGRAVDAELRFDGRTVAVEVTNLAHGAREAAETTRLRRRVSQALAPLVPRLNVGSVAVDVKFNILPPSGATTFEVASIVKTISNGLERLESDSTFEVLSLDPPASWVQELRLVRFGAGETRLAWMVGSEGFGGNLTEIALDWVTARLIGKSTQASNYAEAWLLIVDRYGLIDASDLETAFRAASSLIPANWSAVWLMPASDPGGS